MFKHVKRWDKCLNVYNGKMYLFPFIVIFFLIFKIIFI